MRKLLGSLLLLASLSVYADNNQNSNSMSTMDNSKMMYFDFGLGVGSASGWQQGSLAISPMTMGFYMNKNLGIEIGMDTQPDGGNNAGQAMVMSYHLAAKGVLPLSSVFSLYGKLGLGVNAYEGEQVATNGLGGMQMVNQASIGAYGAAGMQFNFSKNFALYLEGSGVAIPEIGNNGNPNNGSFGSTYQGVFGLEVRI
ncbi:MAG: hypothetical protein K0R14_2218 [Burkholderiales bacterium]|jgi:hypothetical protein|nr:hypothetical protein [Burkholderiales bacterium]